MTVLLSGHVVLLSGHDRAVAVLRPSYGRDHTGSSEDDSEAEGSDCESDCESSQDMGDMDEEVGRR